MLIEKEIIRPGTYWYTDEATGLPRKLDVTPELTRYWHEQGSKMLSSGLTVPVPFEHDFNAHPMTPKDKLLNNAGEVKEYRLRNDTLFGVVDVQDPDAKRKIGHSIRWTSPWINSFTDGDGRQWNNVISHLALTTRPRITKQAPFGSVAAALSIASAVSIKPTTELPKTGICLSKAGRLVVRKKDSKLRPQYPIAFSMFSGGIKFGEDEDIKPLKDDGEEFESDDDNDIEMDADPTNDSTIDLPPLGDPQGDVRMEELLCDLLNALGVFMPENVGESEFKRALYEATMSKIKELTSKGQTVKDDHLEKQQQQQQPNPTSPSGNTQPNPLIQQEQQPMYMSLDDISKITDPTMKTIALSMYQENVKLRAEVEANAKTANSLRDAKLKDATTQRANRIAMLSKLSPRVKADLETMEKNPSMALSMGDGGAVIDPMAQTLAVLEKGLADLPRLLTTDTSALSVQPHPTDEESLNAETIDKLADDMARMMGCPPDKKAS